jgi:hypothetical protein
MSQNLVATWCKKLKDNRHVNIKDSENLETYINSITKFRYIDDTLAMLLPRIQVFWDVTLCYWASGF